jgi:hypothetical protein
MLQNRLLIDFVQPPPTSALMQKIEARDKPNTNKHAAWCGAPIDVYLPL